MNNTTTNSPTKEDDAETKNLLKNRDYLYRLIIR